MGLFDKKFCDICGEKVNMLTQKKLSDGQLCSDCKHKLGSFTSGWKQRTVQDVKNHLEQREQNKQKYQQFNCTATAGGRYSSLQVDFNHRWFIFAIDNRDFKSGNPQVFEISGSNRNTERLTTPTTTVSPTTGIILTTDSLTILTVSAEI